MNKKLSLINLFIRTAACLIVFCLLLTGCKSTTTVPGEPTGSEEIITEIIESVGEPSYETETEFYDDVFITEPGKWQTSVGGQPTVQNLSNYYFDENSIDTSKIGGGTDVRVENYIRGMGRTLYHATEGWNRSATTIALDDANLKELNVTSLRTWGGSTSITDSVPKFTGGIAGVDMLGKTVYEDNAAGTALFAKKNAAKLILEEWKKVLTPDILERSTILLIGNEYRAYNKNGSGYYAYSGYDEETLSVFRNVWLKERFSSLQNLNTLCGTDYKTFDEIMPSNKGNKLIFYEFWLFQRENFRAVFKDVVSGMKDIGGSWGYAGICASNDPFGNNLYIDYFDYNTQNLYANWWKDLSGFVFQLDNLAAWNNDVPVVLTETGFINGTTEESEAEAARKYKQTLNIFYMRPRVAGSYVFDYTSSSADYILNNDTWGMVKPDRTRYKSFDAVAEVYTNFKYLDTIYNGASNTPLVAISNQSTDATMDKATAPENIAKVLYAHGVPIQVVPSDDATRFENLEETKLIFNDLITFEKPNGSGSVAEAVSEYIGKGNKVLRLTDTLPQSLYGISDSFTADSTSEFLSKYSDGLTVQNSSSKDYEGMWNVLGRFIHGDFIAGKVSADNGKINENSVRVLEANATNASGIGNPTYDLNMQMVYKNGRMYLCVVNSGANPIDKVDITIGVNNGVLMNLNPQLIRGDSNVSVSKPQRASIPSYVTAEESKISYGAITLNNLDTYAYIDLGVAINK